MRCTHTIWAVPAICAGLAWGQDSQRPNILLITVDTLRADHLSCYGYHVRTSPNIDRLASEGARFERANTTIPLTGPAHISMFSGIYPHQHGARRNGVAPLEESRMVMLPEVLRRHGYRAAAFVSAWPLKGRLTHLDRWFDEYDEELPRSYQWFNSMRDASDVTPKVESWLERNKARRFFLWVHYFDPHAPYELRDEFRRLEPSGAKPRFARRDSKYLSRVTHYDSEVAYTDHYIGRLLSTLDRLGLRESTLVVLTSDHGESLGEHGYVGHGRQLYENIVGVPLIFRWPGKIPEAKVFSRRVSILDIAPTILDLASLPASPSRKRHFEGRTLAKPLAGDGRPPVRPIQFLTFAGKKGFAPQWLSWLWTSNREMPLRLGMTEDSRKLIWHPRSGSLVIFDIDSDPLEQRPSSRGTGTAVFERETARLEAWFTATASRAGKMAEAEQDLEVLKSLGYLQ
jgi:arylsulfatase A-like enzyme